MAQNADITNCNLIGGTTLYAADSEFKAVGGIVGFADAGVTISNCRVGGNLTVV